MLCIASCATPSAWLLHHSHGSAYITTYAPPPLRVLETPTRDEVDACAATMCEGFWTTSQLTPPPRSPRSTRRRAMIFGRASQWQATTAGLAARGARRRRGRRGDGVARAWISRCAGAGRAAARDDAERKFIAALGRLTTRDPVWKSTILLRAPIHFHTGVCADRWAALFDGNVRVVPLVSNVAVLPSSGGAASDAASCAPAPI